MFCLKRVEAGVCGRLSRQSGFSDGPSSVPPAAAPKGMSLAAQLMEKMGWKEGQGLGKSLQVLPVKVPVKAETVPVANFADLVSPALPLVDLSPLPLCGSIFALVSPALPCADLSPLPFCCL